MLAIDCIELDIADHFQYMWNFERGIDLLAEQDLKTRDEVIDVGHMD